MVYKDPLETILLQLFAHPQNSQWFSIRSALFLRSTLLLRENRHNWYRFVCFLQASVTLNSFISPLPYRCSGVPVS